MGIRVGWRFHLEKARRFAGAAKIISNMGRELKVVGADKTKADLVYTAVKDQRWNIAAKSFKGATV